MYKLDLVVQGQRYDCLFFTNDSDWQTTVVVHAVIIFINAIMAVWVHVLNLANYCFGKIGLGPIWLFIAILFYMPAVECLCRLA